jgi:hypothetical protein
VLPQGRRLVQVRARQVWHVGNVGNVQVQVREPPVRVRQVRQQRVRVRRVRVQ